MGLVLFTMLMIDLTNEIYNSQIKMYVDASYGSFTRNVSVAIGKEVNIQRPSPRFGSKE